MLFWYRVYPLLITTMQAATAQRRKKTLPIVYWKEGERENGIFCPSVCNNEHRFYFSSISSSSSQRYFVCESVQKRNVFISRKALFLLQKRTLMIYPGLCCAFLFHFFLPSNQYISGIAPFFSGERKKDPLGSFSHRSATLIGDKKRVEKSKPQSAQGFHKILDKL